MKVVTLRVPICDNYWDVAELTNEEQGFASEEEYLAYLALKGICSSFQDEDTVHQMSDYFKELVRMTYNKESCRGNPARFQGRSMRRLHL